MKLEKINSVVSNNSDLIKAMHKNLLRNESKLLVINIFVTKDIVEVSRNPLLNEPNLKIIDIPNKDKGKQLWFWIVIRGETMEIMFSGLSRPISVSHYDFRQGSIVNRIRVSDSPFTIKKGLITKNLYDTNSEAYEDVKEFEKSQGTVI